MTKTGLVLTIIAPVAIGLSQSAEAQVKYANRTAPASGFPAASSVNIAPAPAPVPQFEPAPMPDADLYPPVSHTDNPQGTHFTPSLFQPKNQYRGDGFSPGSTVQGSQERLLKPAPGLSMKVPLN